MGPNPFHICQGEIEESGVAFLTSATPGTFLGQSRVKVTAERRINPERQSRTFPPFDTNWCIPGPFSAQQRGVGEKSRSDKKNLLPPPGRESSASVQLSRHLSWIYCPLAGPDLASLYPPAVSHIRTRQGVKPGRSQEAWGVGRQLYVGCEPPSWEGSGRDERPTDKEVLWGPSSGLRPDRQEFEFFGSPSISWLILNKWAVARVSASSTVV